MKRPIPCWKIIQTLVISTMKNITPQQKKTHLARNTSGVTDAKMPQTVRMMLHASTGIRI